MRIWIELWLFCAICHYAYSYAAPFPQGEAPDGTKYKTGYSCENEELHISCDIGETISVIRANYGRFSIAICNKHGYTDWSVNCMSPRTTRVLQTKCDGQRRCKMEVNSEVFGDPCPGTHKYVEVHFACAPRLLATTTKRPLPPWFLQGGADNLWNNPHESNNPTSSSTMANATTTVLTKTIFSISDVVPHVTDQRKPILVTSDVTSTTPVRIPITTSTTSTTPSTTPTTPSTTSTTTSTTSTTTEEASQMTNAYEIPISTEVNRIQKPVEVLIEDQVDNDGSFCRPTLARDVQWSWTTAGETAILPCPLGTSGLARWSCSASGEGWEDQQPDMSDCKSEAATQLEARVRAEDPEAVLATSLAHMTSKAQFYGGDLDTAVAVMKTIGNRLRFILQTGVRGEFYNKEAYVQEVSANMIRAVSNLISPDKRMAWRDLRLAIRMKLMNGLLLAIEEMAFLLADVTQNPELLEEAAANIILAISVQNSLPSDNKFPFQLGPSSQFGPIWNQVQLPKEALQENTYRGLSKSVFFEYKTLHDLLMPAEKFIADLPDIEDYVLNSRIVSASLGQGRHIQLPQKVLLTFPHLAPNLTSPLCVFWNFELSGWSDSGCSVKSSNESQTICQCDHLTNFALLMRPPPELKSNAKLSPTTVIVLEVVTYVAVALSIVFIFIILYKYHRKILKLWDKYCPWSRRDEKTIGGCPKSQSFYGGNNGNLVQVTHNPDTNLTTTNVTASPIPNHHLSTSTDSSKLSHYTSTVEGPPRSFLTLQGQGHVTLNPYQNYGEDLHDGLAATLHLRDSVYMSPQLVKLTHTLRNKKKVCTQNGHEPSNHSPSEEVVFRAVSPHGHVYWEIEPHRRPGQQQPLEDPYGSRQSSRYSDNHPLISDGSSPAHPSVLVNPFADVQMISQTSSPVHYRLDSPELRFSSLRGNQHSPAAKLFTNRSNSARAAKMRDIARQIEQMRLHKDSPATSGTTLSGPSSSSGSTSPNLGHQIPGPQQPNFSLGELQNQIQIRDLKTINDRLRKN